MYFNIHKIFVLLIFLIPLSSAQYEEEYFPATKWYMRAPRSISGLFRRFLGRRKNTIRTGFQGTAIANGPYASQPSSYYSSFLSNPFSSGSGPSGVYPGSSGSGSSPIASASSPGFSSNFYSPQLSSFTNVVGGSGPIPSAGTNYPTYSPPSSGPGSGNPANLDFHAVLDQFVRSAGLSPTGDHEPAASTIQSKGDTPVFSFKKLYSFPFYLSTDQQPADQGFNLQIPYMRKHIRRALHEGSFIKNPKFFGDKQSIQNWLHPKNWYFGQQALQQSGSSLIPTTSTNIQWPNGQETNPLINGVAHQRPFFRGAAKQPIGVKGGIVGHHKQQLPVAHHLQHGSPSTIGSPVVPIQGAASSLVPSGPLKPGHQQPHQPHQQQQQQQQQLTHLTPSSSVSQSTSISSSSSSSSPSSSSSVVSSAPSSSSSSSSSNAGQQQSSQQGSSSGQLADPSILSSQAFIAQYLQEQLAAANQKPSNIKDDQETNESQYASAYYFPNNNKVQQQQQPSSSQQQQGKHQSQLVSGQEKGQPASGITSSSSVSSSSSPVSGDQSSPLSSYQVSYSSGGYGTSS